MKKILSLIIVITIAVLSLPTASATTSTSTSTVFGDANGDGVVSIIDATLVQKHISDLEYLHGSRLYYADGDRSNFINIYDATLIQKKLSDLISVFPTETYLQQNPIIPKPDIPPLTINRDNILCPVDNISGDMVTKEMLWQIEEYFFNFVNQERTSKGLKHLTYSKHLDTVAQTRSLETITNYSHTRPDGTPFYTAINTKSYPYITAGENICYFYHVDEPIIYAELKFTGSNTQLKEAAKNLFNAYKDSPSHYKNMMNKDFKNAGIGISYIWYDRRDIPRFYMSHVFGAI